MRMKSILTIGSMSMLPAPGVVITSGSLAAHPDRMDLIGTLHDTVRQRDSGRATERSALRVDVIDSIGKGGPSYPYMRPINQ